MMISETFKWDGIRYISISTPEVQSPVCFIAQALKKRVVSGNEVIFPEELSQADFNKSAGLNRMVNMQFNISPETAQHLRGLASQLMELDSNKQVDPPFTDIETAVLSHLIEIVPVSLESSPNSPSS